MIHVALFEPEIPPNTGNIIRLCANTGVQLHLIKPLGFSLDDKRMRRAGLDYKEWVDTRIHEDFSSFLKEIPLEKIYACTTKGSRHYHECQFKDGDVLLMGPETRGLPAEILDTVTDSQKIRIPMLATSRSLNLSNATAIILYEALRQLDFPDCQ